MGLGWVLNQMDVRFQKRPGIGDRVTITTGPTGKDRLFTYRDYKMKDQFGNKILEASSKWIIFDIEARKLASYPPDIEDYLLLSNDFDKLERPARLRVKIDRVDYENVRTVRFHELDFNGHMSNNIYFTWLLDAMPDEYLRDKDIRRLNVIFKAEAVYGDKVKVEIQQLDERNFLHQLRKGEEILTQAHSVWE
jgi:medium-chain acyl-[acyl-carrier-protein] hydrolase